MVAGATGISLPALPVSKIVPWLLIAVGGLTLIGKLLRWLGRDRSSEPLDNVRDDVERRLAKLDRVAVGFALFTAVTVCAYSVVDGIGARAAGPGKAAGWSRARKRPAAASVVSVGVPASRSASASSTPAKTAARTFERNQLNSMVETPSDNGEGEDKRASVPGWPSV